MEAESTQVLKLDDKHLRERKVRTKKAEALQEPPDLGQKDKYKLMPFQVSSFPPLLSTCDEVGYLSLMESIGYISSGLMGCPAYLPMRWVWYVKTSG